MSENLFAYTATNPVIPKVLQVAINGERARLPLLCLL